MGSRATLMEINSQSAVLSVVTSRFSLHLEAAIVACAVSLRRIEIPNVLVAAIYWLFGSVWPKHGCQASCIYLFEGHVRPLLMRPNQAKHCSTMQTMHLK